MIRKSMQAVFFLAATAMVGCAPDMEDMEMMPQRPPALDQLDVFMGTWSGEMEMMFKGMDAPMTATGTFTHEWDCDNWVMVGHGEANMGGEMMKSMEIWMWDDKARKFRTFHFYGGQTGNGTAWYDADDRLWRMKGSSRNLMNGMKTRGKGTMKMTNQDTMEWTWDEYDGTGLMKFGTMKGTSHRQ